MADLIPFPLRSRVRLVRSFANDLESVHGPAANQLWRSRIAGVVADLREAGLSDKAIRAEIHDLQSAIQAELQFRSLADASAGSAV